MSKSRYYLDDGDDEQGRGYRPRYLVKGQFIDVLSPTLQHDLTPGQKVTGFNVPLSSFGNSAIDDLQRDLYWSMYLANSNLKPASPEGREAVRGLLEWVLSDPTYKVNVLPFVNHKVSSSASAYGMVEQLMNMPDVAGGMNGLGQADAMERRADDMEQQADDLENQQQDEQESDENQAGNDGDELEGDNPYSDPSNEQESQENQSGNDASDGFGDDDDENPYDDWDEDGQGDGEWEQEDFAPPDPDELRERAENLREQAQSLREEANRKIQDAMGNSMNGFGRSGSIKTGSDFGEEVMTFLAAWGVDEGKGLMLDPNEIMELMRSLSSPGIGGLTTMIGRVHGIAEKTLRGRAPVEVVVETAGFTKDLLAMHPAERFKLTHYYPYRQQAIEDWLERGLGGVTKTMQAMREGNFICFVDESGSMNMEESGGKRETIAKALALGLAKAARENGQEFLLAGFGSHGQVTDIVDTRTSLADLLHWATFYYGGGTSFDYAFTMMMDLVDNLDEEERFKSDFVMITDGEAGISSDVRDRLEQMKEDYGMRIFVLMINADPMNDIVEIADEVLNFTGLDNVSETLSKLIWC